MMCLLFAHQKTVAQIGAATCTGATLLTVNGACGYGSTVGGAVNAGSTPSVCGVAVQGDKWFKFTTSSSSAPYTISATGYSGTGKNIAIQIVSACPATTVGCMNNFMGGSPDIETITLPLSPSTTYFIRIVNLSATPGAGMDYQSVCVTQAPEEDEPAGAPLINVDSGPCSSTTFLDNKYATSSTCAPSPGCGSYVPTTSSGNSVDVWCKLVVPASGNFFLQTSGYGSLQNGGMAVYSSSVCGVGTLLGCSDGNPNGIIDPLTSNPYNYAPMGMPTLNITGAVPNSTVYVRIWNENLDSPGDFEICANDLGPCGNTTDNDFCSNPTAISFNGANAGTVATNTITGIAYTDDYAGDMDVALVNSGFCIYPINNSWYSFIATSADAGGLTIPFLTDDPACQIEAIIFDISRTTDGCCKNFVQLSDCNSTTLVSNPFNVTVPASVLVPGTTYYLMINNSAPAACSFSITGWATTGVLPMELVSFTGNNEGKYNVLEWITASEKNVEFYTLEHSADANNFVPITTIAGKNTQQNTKYTANDENPFDDVTYYRIKQTDKDGKEKYTNTISVSLKNLYDCIFNIHPNPTTDNLNFEYYSKAIGAIEIELINYAGASVLKLNQRLEEGKNNITLPMSQLQNGVYILKVSSVQSGKTTYHKIIKN